MKHKPVLAFLLFTLLTLPVAPPQLCAAEVLLKIAHVTGNVIDTYSKIEGNAFGNKHVLFNSLENVLSNGVTTEPDSWDNRNAIRQDSLLACTTVTAPPQFTNLIPAPGTLVGTQNPSGNSGWHKYIITFPQEEQNGNFILHISSGNNAELDSIAVKNNQGTFERWTMYEPPHFTASDKAVYRVRRSYLMHQLQQPNAAQWLANIVPKTNGIGILVITPDQAADTTQQVLVWAQQSALTASPGTTAKASIVLGWKRPSLLPEKKRGWLWGP